MASRSSVSSRWSRSTSSRRRGSWRHGTWSASSTRASSRPVAMPASTRPTSASCPMTRSRSSSTALPALPESERLPLRRLLDERRRELGTDPALTSPAAWNLGREAGAGRAGDPAVGGRPRPTAVSSGSWHCPSTPRSNPCSPRPSDGLPTDDGWLFEPKWDGFRALVFRDGDDGLHAVARPQAARPLLPGAGRSAPRGPARPVRPRRRGRHRRRRWRSTSRRSCCGSIPPRRGSRCSPRSRRRRSSPGTSSRSATRTSGPCRRASGGRVSRRVLGGRRGAHPPDPGDARPGDRRGVVRAVRGRGARRRRRQAPRRAVPARQAGDAQDQAPADGRLRRRRVPLAQERPRHAHRLAAARAVRRRRPLNHVGHHLVVHLGPPGRAGRGAGSPARERVRGPSLARVGGMGRHGRRRCLRPAIAGRDLTLEPRQGPVVGAAATGARRRGGLRPPPGQPLPARHDVQALATGQAARGVPLRPARGDRARTCSRASSAARAE